VHEYRRFVQAELDARGWRQADLVRRSGLSRQLISTILSDDRTHLGQMPDDATIEGLAAGFSVSAERVRTAAARALAGYTDDGVPITTDLADVPTDVLLREVRRRIDPDAPAV
jgi:transcriptional regulator with XRE-family HTH domain